MTSTLDPPLKDSGIEMFAGAILSREQLRTLFSWIGTDRSFQTSLIANASYWLEFAENMFENRFDSELKPHFFAEFVEPREREQSWIEDGGPPSEFEQRVKQRMRELRREHPGTQYFLYCEPLHPRLLADELLGYASADDETLWEASASIANALWQLETLTGSPFPLVVAPNETWGKISSEEQVGSLKTIQFDPTGSLIVNRQALERSLATIRQIDLNAFEPGRRYFFSHLVD